MGRCAQISAVAVAIVAAFVLDLVYDAGQFKSLVLKGANTCRRVLVPGAPGGFEDFALYRSATGKELVLTGSDAREKWFGIGYGHSTTQSERIARATEAGEHGAMYAYDPSQGAGSDVPRRVRVSGFPHADWHPHGLGSRQLRNGEWALFVVNHRRDGDAIEVLSITDAPNEPAGLLLTYRYSVSHALIRHANDVLIADASAKSLYVTNWYFHEKGTALNAFEAYTQRAWGSVVYCKNLGPDVKPTCTEALGGLKMANGIASTSDDATVYVGVSIARDVKACSRTADGRLSPCDTWHINSAVDNVVVYEPSAAVTGVTPSTLAAELKRAAVDPNTGLTRALPRSPLPHALLAATHPQMLSFVAHEHHPHSTSAPSEVLSLRPAQTDANAVTAPVSVGIGYDRADVFVLPKADAPKFNFSSSSVAGYFGGRLVIGAVFQSGLLVCDAFPDPFKALQTDSQRFPSA